MKISNDLLKDALLHYNQYSELDFIIKPSLPILYFGDLNAYFNSNFKVITAVLNPHDMEFKEFKNYRTGFGKQTERAYLYAELKTQLAWLLVPKEKELWFIGLNNKFLITEQ